MAICDYLMGYLCPTRSTVSDQKKNNDSKISKMHKEDLNSWSTKVGNYIGSFLKTCRIDFFFFSLLDYGPNIFFTTFCRSWLKWCCDQVWLVIEMMFRYIIKMIFKWRKTAICYIYIYIYDRVVIERLWWHNKLVVIVGYAELSNGRNLREKVGLKSLIIVLLGFGRHRLSIMEVR